MGLLVDILVISVQGPFLGRLPGGKANCILEGPTLWGTTPRPFALGYLDEGPIAAVGVFPGGVAVTPASWYLIDQPAVLVAPTTLERDLDRPPLFVIQARDQPGFLSPQPVAEPCFLVV